VIVSLAGFVLDYGVMLTLCLVAFAIYAGVVGMVAVRRAPLSKTEVLVLRWGYLGLFTIVLGLNLLLLSMR
jgi:hypothetical protein